MFCLTRENDEMVFFRNDIHTFTLLVLIVERYCPRIRIHRHAWISQRESQLASRTSKLSFREKRRGSFQASILSQNGIKNGSAASSWRASHSHELSPRHLGRVLGCAIGGSAIGVLRHGESFAGPRGAAAWRQRYATRERGNPRAEDDAERWTPRPWLVSTIIFEFVPAVSPSLFELAWK